MVYTLFINIIFKKQVQSVYNLYTIINQIYELQKSRWKV